MKNKCLIGYSLYFVLATLRIIMKMKVNINDEVRLWNGEEGTVTEVNLSTQKVLITKEKRYPTECHKVNIRYINGEEIDSQNLEL